MRSYAPRVDPETGAHNMPVSQAHEYRFEIVHYVRHVPGGRITCMGARSTGGPARRPVQLKGEYTDAGVVVDHVIQCDSDLDEIYQLHKLERIILNASRRPTRPPRRALRRAR